MIAAWIEDLAERFWSPAGGRPEPPCDLEDMASRLLPVRIITLPGLSPARVDRWLAERGIADAFRGLHCRLHGCLVARGGHGFIFVDGADPPDERRFTIAHEVAHFLIDYQRPRERAIRALGETIVAVLDGERLPTPAERIDAALVGCPLGVHTHLLARVGDPGARAAAAEDRADRLAWELLAPAANLRDLAARPEPDGLLEAILRKRYGLPEPEAERYARYLRRTCGQSPTFVEWLRQ